LERRRVEAPDAAAVRRGYVSGAVGLSAGLGLFMLILYAVLR
jgi:hypothetical protein